MSYRLIDVGFPYKKIMNGRKWVGRVVKCTDGRFLARINNKRGGPTEVYGSSDVEAFEEAVSRQYGYSSANELHAHNSAVRAANAGRKLRARMIANEYMNATTPEGRMAAIHKIFS